MAIEQAFPQFSTNEQLVDQNHNLTKVRPLFTLLPL